MDPFGTMRGARRCSRYFRLLFLAFPDLSGPHFTWAANENTIVVNWGFFTTNGNEEILVPSIADCRTRRLEVLQMDAIDSKTAREFPEPTRECCPPLVHNLGDSEDAARPGHFGTPERFWKWVAKIWRPKVDPGTNFAAANFTADCLLIDPFGKMRGADRCSKYFQLLFQVFPDLSGKYFTWAANQNTIMVNWGFFTTNGKEEILVPSIDIFGFKKGFVHYHLAAFDRVALANALVRAYPDRFRLHFGETLQGKIWRWHVDENFANDEYDKYVHLSVAS